MTWRRHLLRIWSFWPPFLGAGIRLTHIAEDFKRIDVKLVHRWWNANLVGTTFGGSMYMMTDAFYMVMLLNVLGKGFIVWDKSANIRFLKPGKTALTCSFVLTEEILSHIRTTLSSQEKMDWNITVPIKDKDGVIVAEVDKVVYIRRKS
jgi:hypothetical protein